MLKSYLNWESILLVYKGFKEALWEWWVTYALIVDYLIDIIDLEIHDCKYQSIEECIHSLLGREDSQLDLNYYLPLDVLKFDLLFIQYIL